MILNLAITLQMSHSRSHIQWDERELETRQTMLRVRPIPCIYSFFLMDDFAGRPLSLLAAKFLFSMKDH